MFQYSNHKTYTLTKDKETFKLDKAIWTENDYEQMGWHDCSIYGLTFLPIDEKGTTHLVFDIDYIFKWVEPPKPGQPISFWVSPCTLVFKDTFALTINIDRRGGTTGMLEIADLYLVDKVEQEANKWIYEWTINLQEGGINFKSSGFEQIVRQAPIFTDGQFLTLDERNGISFSMTPYQF
jgi:hypothetical protein